MRLTLYEPDIPPNVGTLIRLGACLGVPVDIIEPCGFPWGDRDLKRAAMDYGALAEVTRHASWAAFGEAREPVSRVILLTTKTQDNFVDFSFRPADILLVGRESAGVPDAVHEAADARVTIPMRPPARSLNMAVAAAMVLGEALRQTGGFPKP
ncbi:tRNA (cytidine(34)-2'-O)-methyltransferase [Parvibaculum sp.]|uniref:tRNA (cytidine(34)-2'-O)-methyltransferase n=1 Tax=Parvibaculum sp. TaxID=2024848 RepID=UPI0027309607|nr:tRNA (cytidine(34)-2'-O)-methyltransferase [Parvibaculum sp.]MDP1628937.1 tRNA (cytidine(34)-2'-O)-methyltransferase [Parvibaculum sp.]MDP2148333.1 tRNA (cytidine(34)-2'-O)-methyltransferase [Parvibaculum sp.]MDP3329981.1 tRNA (cytidine(34)-2'-O)-methyltransferase [Parvibaculum sp.]